MGRNKENELWDLAKLDAVENLARESRGKFKHKNLARAMPKPDLGFDKDRESRMRQYNGLVDSCPLLNFKKDSSTKSRKYAVCEKSEMDRKLVYHLLKSYQKRSSLEMYGLL